MNPKNKKWTVDKIRASFAMFYKENGHYPTVPEIDESKYLPSSRQLQRLFGGVPQLRAILNLDCPHDFTKGKYSSNRAKTINSRASNKEKEIYDLLCKRFETPFVHREYFFSDDHRARVDFFVHCKNGNFSVDVFFPRNKHNFISCLNSKMKTYGDKLMLQYPVIFLMANPEIPKNEIEKAVENKKNKLREFQKVMTLEDFNDFCETKIAFRIK